MKQCAVCNEQVLGDHDLCYLHRKYKARLCGTHYATLWDLLWSKARFMKVWGWRIGTKLLHSMEDYVEAAKLNVQTVLKVRKQIADYDKNPDIDVTRYFKILNNLSRKLSETFGVGKQEVFQEGVIILCNLKRRVTNQDNPNMIHQWVIQSLKGLLINHIRRHLLSPLRGTLHVAITERAMTHDDETNLVDPLTVSDAYQRMQQELVLDLNLKKLKEQLSPKQVQVMENMFRADPLTQKELAEEMGTSQPAVAKLTRKVFKKAKEIGKYHVK